MFPDISFLEHMVTETKKFATIKNWKLLVARLCLLTLLILAFAQPYWNKPEAEANHCVVYIDNSMSLSNAKGQKSYFQTQKEAALNLLKQLPANTQVQVYANDYSSEVLSLTDAIQSVSGLGLSHMSLSLPELMALLPKADTTIAKTPLYLFSDMQHGTFLPHNTPTGSIDNKGYAINLITAPQKIAENIYIDTAYFLNTTIDINQPNPLVVSIRAQENQRIKTQLQVSVQGKPNAFVSIDTSASVFSDTINIVFGAGDWQNLVLSINDYPMSFDDTFRMVFHNQRTQEVVSFYSSNASNYLAAAFQTFGNIKYTSLPMTAMNDAAAQGANLILLENIQNITTAQAALLQGWWEAGKHIVMIPDEKMVLTNFNHLLQKTTGIQLLEWDNSKQAVYSITQHHPLFANVFAKISENATLPITQQRLQLEASLIGSPQYLMTYRDGTPFISQHTIGEGLLTFIAAPIHPSISNFALSDYFAPLLYNLASSVGKQQFYVTTVGQNQGLFLPNLDKDVWKIVHVDDGTERIPFQRPKGNVVAVFVGEHTTVPGFYTLKQDNIPENYRVAVNHSQQESVLLFAELAEVVSVFQYPEDVASIDSLEHVYTTAQRSSMPFWLLLVALAIAIMVLETWMALRSSSSRFK